jgi:hypothetical protein
MTAPRFPSLLALTVLGIVSLGCSPQPGTVERAGPEVAPSEAPEAPAEEAAPSAALPEVRYYVVGPT